MDVTALRSIAAKTSFRPILEEAFGTGQAACPIGTALPEKSVLNECPPTNLPLRLRLPALRLPVDNGIR